MSCLLRILLQATGPRLEQLQWATLVDALSVAEFTRSFSQPLEVTPHTLAVSAATLSGYSS